jgi:hypothetical protein
MRAHQANNIQFDIGPLLRRLNDSKLAERQAEALGKIFSLDLELKALVAEIESRELKLLKVEYMELRKQCRKALDTLKAKQLEIGKADNLQRQAALDLQREQNKLRAVWAEMPKPEHYPTQGEYDEFDAKVEQQQTIVAREEERYSGFEFVANSLRNEFAELQQEFAPLAAKEKTLRERIEGKRRQKAGSSVNGLSGIGL